MDLDEPVDGEQAVRVELQSVEEARIHQRIACIELQRLRGQIDLRLDALTPRAADVLEVAKPLQLAGDRQDVVGVGGSECAELPAQRSDVQFPEYLAGIG